ncbi:MAG: beta-lactamase [bacterium]|nr:MAG: beta-lactamase [bacterium]
MRLFRNQFSVLSLSLLGILPAILVPAARPSHVHAATAAQTPPTDEALAARLDQLLAPIFPADKPGATILVARNGQAIYRKGFGRSDMESGAPLRPESVLRIGSVTKQFTAVGILRLAERGKLSVGDTITKWLPDYPTHGRTITIEHLLTHTSGIKGYTEVPEFNAHVNDDRTTDQVIALFKDEPLQFDPGTNWAYSNSGYFLLGVIIEKVSGMSYADFMQKEIFGPLEMTHSGYGKREPSFPGEARGYALKDGQVVPAEPLSMTGPYAAGALVSSLDDLLRWDNALDADRLLKPETSRVMWTPYRQSTGKTSSYGYGWLMSEYEGHPIQEHNGGINGFTCHALRMPDDRLYVAVLTNSDEPPADPGFLALSIAGEALGRPLPVPGDFSMTTDELDRFVGVYVADSTTVRMITRDGDHLVSQRKGGARSSLFPANDSTFAFVGRPVKLTFGRDAKGQVDRVTLQQGGYRQTARKTDDPMPAGRVAISLPPVALAACVGEYQLAPGFILAVTQEGNSLMAQATGQGKFEIFPESETRFFVTVVDAQIEFQKGNDGRMSGLTLHQGGASMTAPRIK